MSNNENLHRAQNNPRDEFYTLYEDVKNECDKYKEYFVNKSIYCNCDNRESAFFQYFYNNFNELQLKELIATSLPTFSFRRSAQHEESDFISNCNFFSEECKKLLETCDIVITNPPFSLGKDFMELVIKSNKEFLVIGSENWITYKTIFSAIKQNKLWEGYNDPKPKYFSVPKDYDGKNIIEKENEKFAKFGNVLWFTNLPCVKREEQLKLEKEYKPEKYLKYDNYDAINIDKTVDIPKDYNGLMGVPITFLSKHCHNQFQIVDIAKSGAGDLSFKTKIYTKDDYDNYSTLNTGPVIVKNGIPKLLYARLLIKRII